MCDLGSYTTSFKGVVIERPTTFLLLFTFSCIMSARSMSINSNDNHLNTNSNVGCAYLESSKELNCFCQQENPNSLLSLNNPEKAIQIKELLSGADVFKSIAKKNIPSRGRLTSDYLNKGMNSKLYYYKKFNTHLLIYI